MFENVDGKFMFRLGNKNLPSNQSTSSNIYKLLINDKYSEVRLNLVNRWQYELGMNVNINDSIFLNCIANWKVSGQSYTRNFSYEVLMRGVYTNEKKYRYGKTISPNCLLCEKYPETLSHVLCNCEISSGFWTSNIKPLLQNLIGISFNFDFNLIMFSEAAYVHGEMRAILTYVLITARWAIWEFRYLKLNNLNPIHPFQNFKTTVRKHYYRMFICPMDNFRKQFNVIELVYKNL